MTDPMNARDMISKALATLVNRPNMAADAVLAILPDMVVPLVWELIKGHRYSGDYVLVKFKNGIIVDYKDKAIACDLTLDEAFAVANAHNVAQVMAGLGIGVDK